jgi:hypothetical protein
MTTYSQRAIFQPRGLAGHAYWRSISPFHGVVFGGMLRNITMAAERARRLAQDPAPADHRARWHARTGTAAERCSRGWVCASPAPLSTVVSRAAYGG